MPGKVQKTYGKPLRGGGKPAGKKKIATKKPARPGGPGWVTKPVLPRNRAR